MAIALCCAGMAACDVHPGAGIGGVHIVRNSLQQPRTLRLKGGGLPFGLGAAKDTRDYKTVIEESQARLPVAARGAAPSQRRIPRSEFCARQPVKEGGHKSQRSASTNSQNDGARGLGEDVALGFFKMGCSCSISDLIYLNWIPRTDTDMKQYPVIPSNIHISTSLRLCGDNPLGVRGQSSLPGLPHGIAGARASDGQWSREVSASVLQFIRRLQVVHRASSSI